MEHGLSFMLERRNKMQTPQFFTSSSTTNNPEVEHRAQKAGDKFSENVHIIANEPSLAFYRIQEHVRKSLPVLIEKKHEIEGLQQEVQGACFDTEYAINAVKSMEKSSAHLKNIQDLLKNSMFMKQQLQYEQTKRNQRAKSSMYRPLSMISRTQTLDLGIGGTSSSLSASPSTSGNADFTQSLQIERPGSAGNSPKTGRVRSSSLSERR